MELGLRLGDSSTSNLGEASNNQLDLGFNTTLSIGPITTSHKQEETKPKKDNNNNSQRNQDHHEETSQANNNPVPQQLDLLPLLSFPWHPASENGTLSAELGGSGRTMNVLPAAAVVEDEAEEGAALSSSPNSAASSFQMDLCMYSRGGSGGGGGGSFSGSGGKRDSDGEAYDEDENGGGGGGNSTRKKLRLSKEQSAFLEESFKEHHTLNPKQKLALSKQLNLRPRQVEVWFQNRRARTKLKQTEVDCEYLKRCCETLTEENRRLHKELQELRALKKSNPFYMQLPATTLTMCPSCERVATNPTSNGTNNVNTNNNNTSATANNTSNDSNSTPIPKPLDSHLAANPGFFHLLTPVHSILN